MFGPSIEVQRLIEHLSNQVMMHTVRRLVQLDHNSSWILGLSKVHPRRDCRAWSAGLETCGDSKCQENTNDRVAGREDSRGKAVAHVPGAC